MATGIVAGQRDVSSRLPDRPYSARGSTQGLGWLPIALGSAVIVAGLGRRNKSTMALALTALAGVAAVAAARDGLHDRRNSDTMAQSGNLVGEPEVERSITIGKTADELRRRWLEPETLPQIMAGFATVRTIADGHMHWNVEGPLGRAYEWGSETVDDRPGEGLGWRSLPNSDMANEGSVRFRPAPADRGTVATLRLRIDPPGGALGGNPSLLARGRAAWLRHVQAQNGRLRARGVRALSRRRRFSHAATADAACLLPSTNPCRTEDRTWLTQISTVSRWPSW